MITRKDVYEALDSELDYQLAMSSKAHGDPSEEGKKKLEQFAYYMEDYMRELKTQLSRTWGPEAYNDALHTMRKITAMGVASMVIHGAPHRVSATKHEKGTDLVTLPHTLPHTLPGYTFPSPSFGSPNGAINCSQQNTITWMMNKDGSQS